MNVWEATVDDNRFACKTVRTDDYTGQLVVTVIDTDEVILDVPVALMFGALFGPDIDDVRLWQTLSLDAIDKWLGAHP